jgi:hypothetical protein
VPEKESGSEVATEDVAEVEIKLDTIRSTLRPPPGLQLPVYSVERSDPFLDLSDASLVSTDAMEDDEERNGHGADIEDDAITKDGSGSTVSDHEHDEEFLARGTAENGFHLAIISLLTEEFQEFS